MIFGVRLVAERRDPDEACQRGTVGCWVDHDAERRSGVPFGAPCEVAR